MNDLKLINMQDIQVEKIEWLLYPFIPYGKVTIIQGDPGRGAKQRCFADNRTVLPPVKNRSSVQIQI